MRIAHIVTYISADRAFGGPVTVALEQSAALAQRGHAVTVFAAGDLTSRSDSSYRGVELKRFPAKWMPKRMLGFAGLRAIGLSRQLAADLKDFDVVHIHLARDLVTIPAARRILASRVPFVVQPHGMIDRSSRWSARLLDSLITRRVLRGAATVLTLTVDEQSAIRELEPTSRISSIRNGVRTPPSLPPYSERRDVLFLARLHPRKRPSAFVEMAALLVTDHPNLRFILAGADEGEADSVVTLIKELGLETRVSWIGARSADEANRLMSDAAVYVLPAVNEVFPMTLLEAFSRGTPSVTTSSLGIADECRTFGAAVITDGSPRDMARAVEEILNRPSRAEALRAGAWAYVNESLTADAVARRLEDEYRCAALPRRCSETVGEV